MISTKIYLALKKVNNSVILYNIMVEYYNIISVVIMNKRIHVYKGHLIGTYITKLNIVRFDGRINTNMHI